MHISQIQLKNFKSFPRASLKLEQGFNAIVGPNGSGKCLRGDSRVLLSDGRSIPIGSLVESELAIAQEKQILDDGLVSLENRESLQVFSINPATGKLEKKRIQAFVKRTSPEKLLKIRTAAGREVVTTKYHPVLTVQDGKIVSARADALHKGMLVAAANTMQNSSDIPTGSGLMKTKSIELTLFWDRIKQIDEIPGEEWVYDLCVEGNHNFLAEGLFVHNSNVVDSLLFAFGESSLKSMRVKKSTDLIFHNHSVAEVTVILNDNGKERSVSRLVNKKGDTKYFLDGKRTKKYAIEEFLSRSNISLSNIIKQGQVQQIVEMNPRDRRTLIDQVANISEYEQKKREAMGELSTVEERLKEAAAILGEREGYLKELENEKNNALKFREMKTELDSLKATLISIDLRAHEQDYEQAVSEMLGLENKASAILAKIRELEAAISLKNSEKDAINQQIIVKSTGSEAELQRHIDSLNNAISNNKKSIEEKKAQLAETEERLKSKGFERQRAFDEVKGAMARIAEVKADLEQIGAKLKERTAEYNQLLSASTGFSHNFHEARAFVQRAGDEMLALKERLSGLQADVASTQEIIDFKQREVDRIKAGQFEDFSEKKKGLAAEREKLAVQLKEAHKALDELFREEKKLNERIPVLEDLLLMAREKKAELSSRLRTLGETQSGKAVEAIMALQEKLPGIYGTVEDLISYDSAYSTSVQVALGNRANFVVADSTKTAAKAIEFIKQRKLGRISFIPLDKIRAQSLTPQDKELAKTKGALGFIVDLLQFEPEHRKAAEFAAGNTLLMRDMPSTEVLIGKIRMVTQEGELVEPSGLLTGGSFTAKINATLERKKLEEWEGKASNAQAERDAVVGALRELRDKMNEARKVKAEIELQHTTVNVQEKNIAEREAGEQGKAANTRSAVAQTRDEITFGRQKIDTLNEERKELVKRLSEINLKMLEAKQKIDVEKEEQLGNAVKEKERTLSDLKVSLSEHENRLASIQTQYSVYEKQAYSLEKEELEAKQLDTHLRAGIKEADAAIATDKKVLAEKTEEQKKVSKAFSALLEKREALDGEIIKKGNEKGKMEFEREAAEREHNEMKVRRAVLETQLTQLKVTFDEYKSAPLMEGKSENDKPVLLARTKEIDAVLREIGNVNLRSIELFEHKLAEFEGQKVRVTQLINEKEAVISVINEIENRKTATFITTFNAINENFRQIFSKIFQGDGHLYLDNPENPLDGGLTIEVKLDNKEVKYLELMSGGEKSLIALCFMLAMQAVTPSTIYILDEADASLDGENSRKLGQLIKTLAAGTQFIIVTHNQQVYKVADCLVGAAMGKDGSHIVEVKLNA